MKILKLREVFDIIKSTKPSNVTYDIDAAISKVCEMFEIEKSESIESKMKAYLKY